MRQYQGFRNTRGPKQNAKKYQEENQGVAVLSPGPATFFRKDLVMKKNLQPFSPFYWFKKGSCQLLAKEWALSTDKLSRKVAQEQYG